MGVLKPPDSPSDRKIEMSFIRILIFGAFLMGCGDSKLSQIQVKIGMERLSVEKLVSEILGIPNDYSPYGNNLRGGIVEYADGSTLLEVNYEPGLPAHWVINSNGIGEHYPPIDEKVISFRLLKR